MKETADITREILRMLFIRKKEKDSSIKKSMIPFGIEKGDGINKNANEIQDIWKSLRDKFRCKSNEEATAKLATPTNNATEWLI